MKYYILLLSVFLSCCSTENSGIVNNKNSELVEIEVNVERADTLRMSDFFSGITYYFLKTPNSEPIGSIFKIMVQGNYVALYDRSKKSVWVFTKKGDYVNEVKIPQGRGAGELEHIADVYFDNNFRIHALGAFKLLVLDLDANLIEETSLDFFITYIHYKNENYYGYTEGNPNSTSPKKFQGYDLYRFNVNGEIQESYLPMDKNKIGLSYGVPNYFPIYKEQTYYFQHLNDTVYSIEAEDLHPSYVFNFGEQTLPEEIFKRRNNYGSEPWQWTDFWENEVNPYDYIAYKTNFEITDRYIHSRVGNAKSKYMILFDRVKKITHIGKDIFVNDIDFGPSPYIYLSSDESLYSYIGANEMLRHLNSLYNNDREKYFSKELKHMRNIADSIREDSNPILMRLDFKK